MPPPRWLAGISLAAAVGQFVACSPWLRLGDIEPPPGKRIVATVSFTGNKALSDADISNKLFHRPESLDPGEPKVFLEPYELGLDRKRIESLYAAHGFFEARVSEARVEKPNPYIVQLHFDITEGAPTRVMALQLNSPTIQSATASAKDPETAALYELKRQWRKLIPVKRGDVWTEQTHRRTKELWIRTLHQRGFAFAQVFGEVLVHRERQVASVTYHVITGPLVRVAGVDVVGAKVAPVDRIIERVDLKPGAVVTSERLAQAEKRVLAMGAFAGVQIALQHEPLAKKLGNRKPTFENLRRIKWPSEVRVRVTVTETTFNELQAGGGLNADSSEVGVFLRVGYTNRDFLGGLRNLKFEAQPTVSVVVDSDQPEVDPGVASTLQFSQPAIFGLEYTQLSIRADYEFSTEVYDSHVLRGSLGVVNSVLHEFTVRGGLSYEYWRLGLAEECSNCDQSGSVGFESLQGLDLDPDEPDIVLAHLDLGATLDLRDSIADPRNGFYASLSSEFAFRWLGSEFSYVKLVGDIRGYYTFSSRSRDYVTLAARLKLGAIFLLEGTSGLPLPVRFKGGGANDMRGYALDQMGPFLFQCPTTKVLQESLNDNACADDFEEFRIGGLLTTVASLEARFYVLEKLALVAFLDVGQVWSELEGFDPELLDLAPGGGLRVYTPVGAIRLDLGGVVRTGKVAVHITLGQAF